MCMLELIKVLWLVPANSFFQTWDGGFKATILFVDSDAREYRGIQAEIRITG